MNTQAFCQHFDECFPPDQRLVPIEIFEQYFMFTFFDPTPTIRGMSSPKKLKTLQMAYRVMPSNEAYLEVGCWRGKSLISAIRFDPPKPVYACDNFSEFAGPKPLEELRQALRTFRVDDRVTFYQADFREIMNRERLPLPLGVYVYDGAHDEASQYQAIKLAEPLLADEALVIVDDWDPNPPPGGYIAKPATLRAIAESPNQWDLLYELPSRKESDLATWWNGLGILGFHRRAETGRV